MTPQTVGYSCIPTRIFNQRHAVQQNGQKSQNSRKLKKPGQPARHFVTARIYIKSTIAALCFPLQPLIFFFVSKFSLSQQQRKKENFFEDNGSIEDEHFCGSYGCYVGDSNKWCFSC